MRNVFPIKDYENFKAATWIIQFNFTTIARLGRQKWFLSNKSSKPQVYPSGLLLCVCVLRSGEGEGVKFSKFQLVRDVREQVRDRLAIVCPANSLCKHHRNVYYLGERKSRLNNFLSINRRWQCSFTWILGQSFMWRSWGMELVTTTASKQALLMREMAGPEKIPWVRMA
jgi:hypothetical protein